MKTKFIIIQLITLILLSLSLNEVIANEEIENDMGTMNSRVIERIFILGILDQPIRLLENHIQIYAKFLFRIVYFNYMFRQIDLEFHFNHNINISYSASGSNVDLNFVGYYNDNFVCGILIYRFDFFPNYNLLFLTNIL
jgi:hypothetical protein